MSFHTHRSFTCMAYPRSKDGAFAADISALALIVEDHPMQNLSDLFVTAIGMNGLVVATLLPHGGSLGREWDKAWVMVKVQLKEIAVRHKADWIETSFGQDHEGAPFLETNSHKMGAGGVCSVKGEYSGRATLMSILADPTES